MPNFLLQDTSEGESLKITAAGQTDVGKVRKHNEDAFAIVRDLGLFIVSDGIGGHQAGEVAAEVVVKALPVQVAGHLKHRTAINPDEMVSILDKAVSTLSRRLYDRASKKGALRGMGATVAVCWIQDAVAALAHMGDSRIYLMRDGELQLLTKDHSVSSLIEDLGRQDAGKPDEDRHQHVLTRYVGMEADVGPQVHALDLQDGDRLMICSDGLPGSVAQDLGASVLWTEPDIRTVCKKLVDAANTAGGTDNITVVVVQYGDWENRPEHEAGEAVSKNRSESWT